MMRARVGTQAATVALMLGSTGAYAWGGGKDGGRKDGASKNPWTSKGALNNAASFAAALLEGFYGNRVAEEGEELEVRRGQLHFGHGPGARVVAAPGAGEDGEQEEEQDGDGGGDHGLAGADAGAGPGMEIKGMRKI